MPSDKKYSDAAYMQSVISRYNQASSDYQNHFRHVDDEDAFHCPICREHDAAFEEFFVMSYDGSVFSMELDRRVQNSAFYVRPDTTDGIDG